jgi:hypothetical protein
MALPATRKGDETAFAVPLREESRRRALELTFKPTVGTLDLNLSS